MDKTPTLRDNTVWKDAYSVAKKLHAAADSIEKADEEEKWRAVGNMRLGIEGIVHYASDAVAASGEPEKYGWVRTKRALFSTQSTYAFAAHRGLIALDVELMIEIDKLLERIEEEIRKANKLIEIRDKAEQKG